MRAQLKQTPLLAVDHINSLALAVLKVLHTTPHVFNSWVNDVADSEGPAAPPWPPDPSVPFIPPPPGDAHRAEPPAAAIRAAIPMVQGLAAIARGTPGLAWDVALFEQLGQGWATWMLWLFRNYIFALFLPGEGDAKSAPSAAWQILDFAAVQQFTGWDGLRLSAQVRQRFDKVALVRFTVTAGLWCWWSDRPRGPEPRDRD